VMDPVYGGTGSGAVDANGAPNYVQVLEGAGCRVIYGLPDKKVHSKLCLITRNVDGERRYITQVGTGNYNELTGEHYCDLSLITADPVIGADAETVFAALEKGGLRAAVIDALGATIEKTAKLVK